MAPPILSLRGIHLGFGGAPLLAGVELFVAKGERLALAQGQGSLAQDSERPAISRIRIQ